MDLKTIIRTSAIIYADETTSVSTKTIQRKFIEAVFIENENKPLSINNLLSEIEKKFNLSFLDDETQAIVNKADKSYFEIKFNGSAIENTIISLSESRYRYLKNNTKITQKIWTFYLIFSFFSALSPAACISASCCF